MKQEKAQVIIPPNIDIPPSSQEIETAWILARYYQQSIEFLKPLDDYKRKTPDFVMSGILWEMKSPEGNSKTTIGRILKRASKQSRNIVIDCNRTALTDDNIIKVLRFELGKRRQIKKIILVTKNKEIVELP